ncbi:MAG: LacI family DNA-binding transcriptional regulator [Verrucomicrobiota bacterium]
MSVTLREIADASNVSVSTASRALSGNPSINRATAERVREAAEQLNYRSRRQVFLEGADVGLLCLGIGRSLTSLPTIAGAIEGAELALAAEGARTVFNSIPDLESPPRSLLAKVPDALILVGPLQGSSIGDSQSSVLGKLRALPSVWMVGKPEGAWGDLVGTNDYEVGALAAKSFLDAGHQHLAFINPKPDHELFCRREDGFRAAARRGKALSVHSFCEAPEEGWPLPLQAPKNVEAVQALVDQAIAQDPRPTGLFAAADSIAVLVYRALARRGYTVGKDFSLISGNNDEALIAGLHPSLTTCDIDAFSIGQRAVRQLSLRLEAPDGSAPCETLLTPKMVVGESLARLRP